MRVRLVLPSRVDSRAASSYPRVAVSLKPSLAVGPAEQLAEAFSNPPGQRKAPYRAASAQDLTRPTESALPPRRPDVRVPVEMPPKRKAPHAKKPAAKKAAQPRRTTRVSASKTPGAKVKDEAGAAADEAVVCKTPAVAVKRENEDGKAPTRRKKAKVSAPAATPAAAAAKPAAKPAASRGKGGSHFFRWHREVASLSNGT